MKRIAILGAGRIGEALLTGLRSSGWTNIVSTTRVDGAAANPEAVRGADVVVISVKPQDMDTLLAQIHHAVTPEQMVHTLAAAIPTAYVEERLPAGIPVVRAMPNAPSVVHEGMAGIAGGAHATDEHLAIAEDVLAKLGRVVRVPESALDAVTAISGSGPAYFALLAEAMIEGGLLLGLSREISTTLVVQTMLGTAKELRDEGMHPVELRESVTSPGGTTIAAIRELEQAGVRAAFLNAIQAAMTRARELASGG
jgi:pyrroline-5-carboxylate reductase